MQTTNGGSTAKTMRRVNNVPRVVMREERETIRLWGKVSVLWDQHTCCYYNNNLKVVNAQLSFCFSRSYLVWKSNFKARRVTFP